MIDLETGMNASLFIDRYNYSDEEIELLEKHVLEYEMYAEEERILRDEIQKQIAQGEYATSNISKTAIVKRDMPDMPEYYSGERSLWQRLRDYMPWL